MDSNFIANPQQPELAKNPLVLAQGILGLQGQQLANQNQAKTIAANKAMSQIVQQATNPDGTIDYRKLHTLAAASPDAAYNLQQATQAASSNEATDIANQESQLKLTQDRLSQVGQRLTALYVKPNTTPDEVREAIGDATKEGLLNPDIAMQELKNIPDDPSKVKDYLGTHMRELNNAMTQLQMNEQHLLQIDTGSGTALDQTNLMSPVGAGIQGVVPRGVSASQAASPIQATDANGNPYLTTQGAVMQQVGTNPQTGMPQQGAPDLSLPGVDQGGASLPPNAIANGPSPLQQASWQAAVARQQAREAEALGANGRVAGLQMAAQKLGQLSDTSWAAGPRSREVAEALGALNTLGIPVDTSRVNSRAEVVKLLENAVNNSAREAGFNGSNDRLDAWKAGQTDPDKMPPGALKAQLAYLHAQTVGQALMARYVHDYAAQNGPQSIAQAEQNWSRLYNPNSLYLATLSPEQRAKAVKQLGKGGQQDVEDYRRMIQAGLFRPADVKGGGFGETDAGY